MSISRDIRGTIAAMSLGERYNREMNPIRPEDVVLEEEEEESNFSYQVEEEEQEEQELTKEERDMQEIEKEFAALFETHLAIGDVEEGGSTGSEEEEEEGGEIGDILGSLDIDYEDEEDGLEKDE